MNEKMPVLFIGHGSPMNIILNNGYTQSLMTLGKSLPRPRAIMVISAHWLTTGTYVTCMEQPRTIHDFYGFPNELYRLRYMSPGSPAIAREAAKIVGRTNIGCNSDWGLDHASWAVLKHMYPDADIPVVEMSLDYTYNEPHPKPIQYHFDLAKELGALRREGVLIIGSGNIVHNLTMIDFENIDAEAFRWAQDFDKQVKANLINRNYQDLIHFHSMGEAATFAVPTLDHYLPMIYTIALQDNNEPLAFIYEGFQYASVSMRSFKIG